MIMARLRSLLSGAPKREAQEVYIALVRQSRKPFFYGRCQVPDSLDGRFEILVLHVFLTLRFFKAQGGQEELSRLLQECLFDDMDRSLREMGVGDMGVGRRIKSMSKAAFGRFEAYTQAFDDDNAFLEALKRNVYRGAQVSPQALALLLDYARGYVPGKAASP
jgi:cytochrome b pre-mRNA-processing protein 3